MSLWLLEDLAIKRLAKELRNLRQDTPSWIIHCGPRQEDDLMLWDAVISGPDNTPWEGGEFKLTLEFSENYPFRAPYVRFVSEMYHPNVSPHGNIYFDLLQSKWSPALKVVPLLLSIRSLLAEPNPETPANVFASRDFIEDKSEYNNKVMEVVRKSKDEH